jgi:hypothetical protein
VRLEGETVWLTQVQIAHIVDMHQLTKDPEAILMGAPQPNELKKDMDRLEAWCVEYAKR